MYILYILDQKAKTKLFSQCPSVRSSVRPQNFCTLKINACGFFVWKVYTGNQPHGIQIWGSAADSNNAIFKRFQTKILRLIANAPWYITNKQIYKDLQVLPTVQEEIKRFSTSYFERLINHCNPLAQNIAFTYDASRRLPETSPTRSSN